MGGGTPVLFSQQPPFLPQALKQEVKGGALIFLYISPSKLFQRGGQIIPMTSKGLLPPTEGDRRGGSKGGSRSVSSPTWHIPRVFAKPDRKCKVCFLHFKDVQGGGPHLHSDTGKTITLWMECLGGEGNNADLFVGRRGEREVNIYVWKEKAEQEGMLVIS